MNISKKWDGLKNYASEKLITGAFVVGAVSGRSFVAARTAIAAMPLSQDSVWQSPITRLSANQPVVLKWMMKIMEVPNLWGWNPATAARIRENIPQDPELKARQEAEKEIEKSGIGQCAFCQEEVIKNERGFWESESLVEYCAASRDHKHRPTIVYKEING